MSESYSKDPVNKPTPEQDTFGILNRKALEQAHKDQDDLGYKQRQLRFNKWLTILTGFLVITSIVAICISITASDAAKKSADAATAGVLVASNTLSLNKESVEKTLAEMKVQSTASKINAEESRLQALFAKKSLENGIESFRLDERAWIELEPFKPVLSSKADETFGASFNYEIYPKNVGKTVASNIELRASDIASGIQLGDNADRIRSTQDMLLRNQYRCTEYLKFLLKHGFRSAIQTTRTRTPDI